MKTFFGEKRTEKKTNGTAKEKTIRRNQRMLN